MPSDDNPKYERVGFLRLAGIDQYAGRRLALPDWPFFHLPSCDFSTPVKEPLVVAGRPHRGTEAVHRPQYCWPLSLPGRVLPGNGEVRDIFPHLDEAQLD